MHSVHVEHLKKPVIRFIQKHICSHGTGNSSSIDNWNANDGDQSCNFSNHTLDKYNKCNVEFSHQYRLYNSVAIEPHGMLKYWQK